MDNVKLRWRPIEFPGAVVSTSDVPLELPFNDNSVWVDLDGRMARAFHKVAKI